MWCAFDQLSDVGATVCASNATWWAAFGNLIVAGAALGIALRGEKTSRQMWTEIKVVEFAERFVDQSGLQAITVALQLTAALMIQEVDRVSGRSLTSSPISVTTDNIIHIIAVQINTATTDPRVMSILIKLRTVTGNLKRQLEIIAPDAEQKLAVSAAIREYILKMKELDADMEQVRQAVSVDIRNRVKLWGTAGGFNADKVLAKHDRLFKGKLADDLTQKHDAS